MVGNNIIHFLANAIVIFTAFLIALSFHEFSHAYVANLFGDDTAKRQGRLTLNPFAHLDFWGTIFLLVLRIGWAKPVPFDIKNFKKYPRTCEVLTALAGPVSNILLAIPFLYLVKYTPLFNFSKPVNTSLLQVFEATAYVNVMLGVFNLIPIPPLDGSHFISALLYKKYPQVMVWLYRYSLYILLFVFFIPSTQRALIWMIMESYQFIRALIL